MTHAEIVARLVALHAALVEKIGGQPYFEPKLTINQSGRCYIHLYQTSRQYADDGHELLHSALGYTPAEALADAEAFVRAMPDPDARARHDWHRKLGDVIDEGHALNLPDEVMQPLRAGSQAMSENLLAAPVREDV